MAHKQKMRSTLLLSIAMFVSCLALCFTMNFGVAQKANAQGEIFANQEIQIRLKTQDSEICGIRFTITVDAAEAASLANPEYGVLVAKTNDLNGKALNFDLENFEQIASKVPAQVFAEESDTAIVYQVVINNIPESDYNTKITAVPYAIDGETVIVAEEGQSYAIAEVANILVSNGSNEAGLLEYIDSVLETGEVIVPTSLELTKGEEKKIDVTVNPSYLTPSYSTEDDSIITVDKQGVVTAIGLGTANVIVEIGSTKKTVPVTVVRGEIENPGMFYDYDNSFATIDNASAKREYLASYQGATGVYHTNLKQDGNILLLSNVTPVHEKWYYSKHNTIALRMQQSASNKMAYNVEKLDSGVVDISSSVTLNDLGAYVWIETEFNADTFLSYIDNYKEKSLYGYSGVRDVYLDAVIAYNKVNVTSNVANVFVGVPYTVSDNAQEAFDALGIELYDFKQTVLLNGVEVTLNNGAYTPTEAGRLEVIYTAVDEDGVLYRARYYYDVDEAGMLLNFAKKTLNRNTHTPIEYLETYAGVDGVTHVSHASGNTAYFYEFKHAPYTSDYYSYYDTLIYKVHGNAYDRDYTVDIKSRSNNAKITTIQNSHLTNKWVEMTASVPSNIASVVTSMKQQGVIIQASGKVDIYYSKIYLAKAVTVNSSVGNVFEIGKPVVFNDNASSVMSGMTITREVTINGLDVALDAGNTSFTPTSGGTYHVIVKGVDAEGRLHRGEYDIHVGNPGMVYDFSRISYKTENDNYIAETTQDENGNNVLHVKIKKALEAGSLSGIAEPIYTACFDSNYYSTYDTLVVEVKSISGYSLFFATISSTNVFNVGTADYKGTWAQLTTSASNFKSNLALLDRIGAKIWQGAANDLYLRSVYLCKATTITGNVTSGSVGSAITLSDNASTAMSGMTITREVLLNGNPVQLTDGVFTPSQAGTYTVVVKGVDANNILYRGVYTITVA